MKVNNSKGQLTYQIEIDKQQKNGFPIDCDFMTTGKMGCIYPTQALPVNYGDRINNNSSAVLQFNPLAVPMLANMFIKQEHYYTPRNCVWQNWDNFISGGEDLQFNTPPPSASMAQVYNIVHDLVGALLDYGVIFDRKTYGSTGTLSRIMLSFVPGMQLNIYDKIHDAINNLKTYGNLYGIYDIINNYFIKVIEDMRDNLFMNTGTMDFVLFRSAYSTIYDSTTAIADGYMMEDGYVMPDDWTFAFEQIKALQSNGILGTNELSNIVDLVPTELALRFYQYLYKLVRPICGVGSYLDCLNMNRVTPADFNYLLLVSLTVLFNGEFDIENGLSVPQEAQFKHRDFASTLPMDCLNLRTQYLIWYNNYRDQLLEVAAPKPVNTDTVTPAELLTLLVPRHRCWEKDSYTTALDNPATVDAVVPAYNQRTHSTLTMQSFEVQGAGAEEIYRNDGTVHEIKFSDGEKVRIPTGFISGLSDAEKIEQSNTTNYYFSLHMLDAVKRAQKFLRKAVFYGNRIQDFIYTTFSVQYLDARLRLPEILSTSNSMVQLSTLVNNTTTAVSNAGDRAGYANGDDDGNGFSRYCEEAGVIMSFLTVMPQPTYPYGSDRQYYKFDRYDHPIPDFATLGMDAVYDSEIVSCPNKVLVDNQLTSHPLVFGYQGRYYDSKFRQSTEHGELLTTQDMYTFGRKWNMYKQSGRPRLNYQFVHCFPDTDMFIMKDNTEDIFRADVHHETTAELMLPYHSIYL